MFVIMSSEKKLKWEVKSWENLSKDDFYKIASLRISVFVIEQDCPYQDLDGNDMFSDHVFAKDEDGVVVGYSRIVSPGKTYPDLSIGRVVVAADFRGQKLGKELMERSLAFSKEKYGNVCVHISAQEHLCDFYQELGFVQITKMYLEDDIPHIGMDLELIDFDLKDNLV